MDFAIVAMDCVLPGALGPDALLRATREGIPAFREVPAGRWPAELPVDPTAGAPDAVSTRVGGFVEDPPFSAEGLQLGPAPIDEVDPLFRWVLRVVRGVAPVSRARTDLFLANLSLPTTGAVRAISAPYREALSKIGVQVPWLDGGTRWDVWQSGLPAKLAAAALGLGGRAVALDAACASGLYAVRLACDRLEAGLCDDAIAAGVNRADSAFLFLGFSQLRALSKSGQSRPFDRRADGLLVGEGAAAVRIRRLDDAIRDGDTIHAVIRGGGLGNDGRKGNLLAPDRHGQLRTLRAAWAKAGLDPRTAGLIECHATGTVLGDRTEVEALQALFEEAGGLRGTVALSSSKALMGHLVTCAGLAGLMRAVFAVRDGFLPAIPCEDPIDLGDHLRVPTAPSRWDAEARIAGVSAFGFGGTNAHVVVERWRPGASWRREAPERRSAAIAVVGIGARIGDLEGPDARDALLIPSDLRTPAPDVVTRGLATLPPGVFASKIELDGARWRIPPSEIERLLPQHLMALTTAAEAIAGLNLDPERTASIVGMSVDHHIGEDVIRAAVRGVGRPDLADAIAPAIDASRIQGLLPNFVANRLAAVLDLRGPSYTVSSENTSGIEAIYQATELLRRGDVDAALVGAVDAPGQVGAAVASGRTPAEGAAMFVLQRLDDAIAAGHRVHAVLRPWEPGDAVTVGAMLVGDGLHRVNMGDFGAADGAMVLLEAVLRVRDGVAAPGAPDDPPAPWLTDRTPRVAAAVVETLGQFDAPTAEVVEVAALDTIPAEAVRARVPVILLLRASDADGLRSRLADAIAKLEKGAALTDFEPDAGGGIGFACVAENASDAIDRLRRAEAALAARETDWSDPRGGFVRRRVDGRVAFVYPGAGTAYPGMATGLLLGWPWLHRALDARTTRPRTQLRRGAVESGDLSDPVDTIVSGAWTGILVTDLLRDRLGLVPDDAIGVSLGESAALMALGAWRDLDAIEARMAASPIFRTELAGPMDAVRRAWTSLGIDFDPADPYRSVVLAAPRAAVEAVIGDLPAVHLQMVDAPDEVVIGGERRSVEAAIARLPGVATFPAPLAACVHSPEVEEIADLYRDFHRFEVHDPGVRVWSADRAAPYAPSTEACADAIVRQACGIVDVPRLIRAAWDAGVRVFVEVGPKASCTRWIDGILADVPHLAVACTRPGADEPWQLALAVAELCAAGIEVDPRRLFPAPAPPARAVRPIVVPHSGPPIRWDEAERPAWSAPFGGDDVPSPLPGSSADVVRFGGTAAPAMVPLAAADWTTAPVPPAAAPKRSPEKPAPRPIAAPPPPEPVAVPHSVRFEEPMPSPVPDTVSLEASMRLVADIGAFADALTRSQDALADAHDRYLASEAQVQAQLDAYHAMLAAVATDLPTAQQDVTASLSAAPLTLVPTPSDEAPAPAAAAPRFDPSAPVPRQLGRRALERFAAGRISEALGPAYADLDDVEPRVRLPMDPLLLVSRVVDVEGHRGKLGASRIITEYDIPVDAWWSHDGEAPPCVCIESGQADLLLVSYLGIDAITRGKRVYRLLDCDLVFHGPRPRLGETLRHDIRIHRFAKLGDTILFYFEYDCVSRTDGRPVLSMRSGCAGFFTPKELETPQGARIPEDILLGMAPPPRIPGAPRSIGPAGVDALTEGRFSDALGPAFAACDGSTLTLSRAPWRLVHRVPVLETSGGPHGLGRVVVEQDLRDDDWFNPCHFLGDPCMPGTLMFDGCCQALSLWLIAQGYPADFPKATFEPVPEVAAKLRCRGQVVPGHSLLSYDVRVKKAGTEPTPWVIADVILSVDGTPVVLAEDVSIRIHGEKVVVGRPTVDEARVLEYSVGDPSRAFGDRFLPYDHDLRTARMPGPPFLTMTRVIGVDGPQGEVAADKAVDIELEVPEESWYFAASPGTSMPFAQLTETTLQPCGWLTAWQAAALTTKGDVYFRNLGGTLTLHRSVWPGDTVVTTARQTSISRSGGMLIHAFDVAMRRGDTPVLECRTQFGYFTAAALQNQKGLAPDREDRRTSWRESGRVLEDLRDAPIVHGIRPRADLRMLDRITAILPDGGKERLGFWAAEKDVDPTAWFYWAHFHQDPVMPGSLGMEAACQLAREVLLRTFGAPAADEVVEPMAPGTTLVWKYRGQVPPDRKVLGVEIEVLAVDKIRREITVDALVRGDGMPIYEVQNLVVRIDSAKHDVTAPVSSGVAALLDTISIDGDRVTSMLRLDRSRPWYRDHCPTVVVPALPMAFAAEVAAEVAAAVAPGRKVIAIEGLEARKWIAGDEAEVRVEGVVRGDRVDVTLSMWAENKRFSKLSGWQVHMLATAVLGDAWPAPEVVPEIAGDPVTLDARTYYDGGHTFHGPSLQGMTAFGVRGPEGITATFETRPDAELTGEGRPAFLLDPLLLDTATHPMLSGMPETWVPGLAPGKLAYPIEAERMRFFGPRPEGRVDARLRLVSADASHLCFDVWLSGAGGLWASFRWTETLVDGGPVLGRSAEVRRPFCWERRPDPGVRVGRPDGSGWRVDAADLVEPLAGTLVRLYGTAAEVRAWAGAADPHEHAIAWIAAKEAALRWVLARTGKAVHPTGIVLVRMRPDRFVVTDALGLTAQEITDNLGPTRFDLGVVVGKGTARAEVVPRDPADAVLTRRRPAG